MTEEEQINEEFSENNENEEIKENFGDSATSGNSGNSEESEEIAESTSEEKDPLDVALDEIAQLKDQLLRKAAEFENYRKRTTKEKAELVLNGGKKTVTALLPIVDDMERAIENQVKTDDIEAIREGIVLIHQKFIKILGELGVKAIDTTDADFDTDLHEAVALVPGMGEDKKGKVIDCVQTGYTMNDTVIRHAKVAVGQ